MTSGERIFLAYLPHARELVQVSDDSDGHQNSPFCGRGSLLILGVCTLVAMGAPTGALGWHQCGRTTNVTRAEQGTLDGVYVTVVFFITNNIPQSKKGGDSFWYEFSTSFLTATGLLFGVTKQP